MMKISALTTLTVVVSVMSLQWYRVLCVVRRSAIDLKHQIDTLNGELTQSIHSNRFLMFVADWLSKHIISYIGITLVSNKLQIERGIPSASESIIKKTPYSGRDVNVRIFSVIIITISNYQHYLRY